MNMLYSQLEERTRLDVEMTERAYAELAASVTAAGRAPYFDVDDLEQTDSAVKMCLKYCGVESGEVDDSITDVMERIEWLCRPSGTMRRGVNLTGNWYKRAIGPMVARLDTGSVVALIPGGLGGYRYLSPDTRGRVRVTSKVARHIESDAMLFYKPLPTHALKIRDLVQFIIRVFDRGDYAAVFIAALAVTLIGLIPAQAQMIAFDLVVPSGDIGLVAPIGLLLLGVAIATALIGACRNLVMTRVATKLNVMAEAATFARIMLLPSSFFKQYSSGDLANRVSNVTFLCQKLATLFLGSVLTACLSLVYVLQIGAYAPYLAIPALAIVSLQAVTIVLMTRATVHYEQLTTEKSAKISGVVTALLNGVQKIKVAGAENRAFAKWAHGYAEYANAAYNRPPILWALAPLVTFIGLLGTIVIYYLVGTTNVSVANFMAFNVAYGQMSAAIIQVATMAGEFAQIGPIFQLISPILAESPEIDEDKPGIDHLQGGFEMANVSFRYNEDAPYVLNDVSLKVRPGEYVALVGKSGCGKSTIIRLLLGFEQPTRGAIYYGVHNLQRIDIRSLRRHVGVVMQDGKLFMGDIASNITISTPRATVDDAWEAAEIAGIADDIRKMPMGMQTLVSEGSGGVSGGQRQRLMIARAVCGGRNILMLDEATSALDNVTQKHVIDSLGKLECTRLVVAHRLTTVKHCDRILMMEEGRIVEEGTYEELIKNDGPFAALVRHQQLD